MNLDNYVPKGKLKDFPIKVIYMMLKHQVAQGNPEDVTVFEENSIAGSESKGFTWSKTEEGHDVWYLAIVCKDFRQLLDYYFSH